jgi:aminopeptidase N
MLPYAIRIGNGGREPTRIRRPPWARMRQSHLTSSHAIQQHVTDELHAMTAFDSQITYNKGQSILRMFEAYLPAR